MRPTPYAFADFDTAECAAAALGCLEGYLYDADAPQLGAMHLSFAREQPSKRYAPPPEYLSPPTATREPDRRPPPVLREPPPAPHPQGGFEDRQGGFARFDTRGPPRLDGGRGGGRGYGGDRPRESRWGPRVGGGRGGM